MNDEFSTERDHLTRGSRLSRALSLFERSIATYPTPAAFYHRALALYCLLPGRDLDRAIESARLAVEGDSSELLYWHLLGLLLIASEDWRGAINLLGIGAAVGD